jgi:anti-sigma-K factor RskA
MPWKRQEEARLAAAASEWDAELEKYLMEAAPELLEGHRQWAKKSRRPAPEQNRQRQESHAAWKWLAAAVVAFALVFGTGFYLFPTGTPVADQASVADSGESLVIKADVANVRGKASIDSPIVAKATRDTKVTELLRDGEWVKVIIPGAGVEDAWIHSSLLAPQIPSNR